MSISPPELNLDSPYPLTENAIQAYQRDGHVQLPGVCSPQEVATFKELIEAAVARLNRETRPLEERDTYGKAFLQIMNLWTVDEAIRRFVLAKRFGRIAAELMGVKGVRLYHDQALFKEPGGGPTPWHQDQFYWPLDTDHTITMWMPLVEITPDMRAMTFASGSHRDGFLGHLAISDESEAAFEQYVAEKGYPKVETPTMAAGDATFHSGWTLHSAPGNPTDRMRSVMTIIYFADGTRVAEPDNANREADLATWLPGLRAGDLAASELNPLVYSE